MVEKELYILFHKINRESFPVQEHATTTTPRSRPEAKKIGCFSALPLYRFTKSLCIPSIKNEDVTWIVDMLFVFGARSALRAGTRTIVARTGQYLAANLAGRVAGLQEVNGRSRRRATADPG